MEPNGLNQIQPGVRSCEAWTTFDVDSHIDDTYDTFFFIFFMLTNVRYDIIDLFSICL